MINKYIWFLIVTALIYFTYRIIILLIKRSTRKMKFPAAVVNAVKLIARIIAIFAFTVELLVVIEIPDEFIISISSVSGLIIGFSSSEIMSQLISGIYLISTKPFEVNDLISLNGTEGIVIEIGISYTIIQRIDGTIVKIPNKSILDSKVKNFTVEISEELDKRNIDKESLKKIENLKELKEMEEISEREEKFKIKSLFKKMDNEKIKNIYNNFSDFILEDKLTRYTFDIQIVFNIDPKVVLEKLDNICVKYESVYKFKPVYSITDLGYRATIQFIIITTNSQQILDNHPTMMQDIAEILYTEEESI